MRRRLVWIQGAHADIVAYRFSLLVGPDGTNNFNTSGQIQFLVTITSAPFNYEDTIQNETSYLGTAGNPSPPNPTGTTLQDKPGTIEFIVAAKQRMQQLFIVPASALSGLDVSYFIQSTTLGVYNGNRHLGQIGYTRGLLVDGVFVPTALFSGNILFRGTSNISRSTSMTGTFTLTTP